jgi:hypothetical protein
VNQNNATPATKRPPHPGDVWKFKGIRSAYFRDTWYAPPSGPHRVVGLRVFRGAEEALFDDGVSCAGVDHMVTNSAWERVS